jgi:GNAT superfamily N-acetyltransferase
VIRVVAIDPATLAPPGDELVRAVNRFDRQLWAESDPGEPELAPRISAMWLAETWQGFEHHRWMAQTPAGEVVGFARVDVHVEHDDDPTASVRVQVAPAWRRQGVGSQLLLEAVERCAERGRSVIGFTTTDRVPAGEPFAQRLGGVAKLVQRESECDISAIDTDMVARWLDLPTDVTDEYELWRVVGPYDPSDFAAIARIQNVMNTAPSDDLERRDVQFSAAHVAHTEAQRDFTIVDRWSHFIRHRPSGDLVGLSRLYLWRDWKGMAEQGDTAVDPAHRGHGLGKWLKGSMVRHLLDERPDATRIRTANAYTNGPMLAINDALGFRVTRTMTDWQAPIEAVHRGCARRR